MVAPRDLMAPIPTPLPASLSDDHFSEAQWQILFALVDAVVPPIVTESTVTDKRNQLRISQTQYEEAYERILNSMAEPPSLDKFKEYLRTKQSDNPRFVKNVKRTLESVPEDSRKKLGGILDFLGTRIGSFILTGYCTPVQDLPLHIRHQVFQSWTKSWMRIFPVLARSISIVSQKAFSQADPLYHRLIGYTDHPADYAPGPEFDFNFMQFTAEEEPEIIEVDVVIVGSGCGGGVCAKVLAEAGHRVLVVDKGYYFPPSQLPMDQESGPEYLFDSQGLISSDDSCLNVLAGSCWGGGGTVNWSVSLEPPETVRKEWADKGLRFFATEDYQHSLDRVCSVMGVSDAYVRHNHGGQVIIDGARKLGWAAKTCPQNTGEDDHYCGRCNLGCASAGKKGPAVTWLPAASKAGAKFVEGFHVSELLFDESTGVKKAVGLSGTWTSRDKNGGVSGPASGRVQRTVRVKAKKVIISAGTLQSPLLLLRSGLKNPHIGKNLYLHPCNYVMGRFAEDIQPWEGSSITSLCSEFDNLDSKGHGVRLETVNMVPFMTISNFPWYSGLDFKLNVLKFRNMNGYISIVRDRDTGRVYPDPISGRPRVDYTPSTFDRAHGMTGIVALAKLCYVEGAQEIFAFLPGTKPFVRSKTSQATDNDINDPEFVAWLASIEKAGNKSPVTPFGSAHQMGTCRMSGSAADGVVDPKGRAWEAEDLYVADSSVFPSASGVNPMVTVMAIADYIARGIATELSEKS